MSSTDEARTVRPWPKRHLKNRTKACPSPAIQTAFPQQKGQEPANEVNTMADQKPPRDPLASLFREVVLVLGATVYGLTQREVGGHLGLSHEATRKRFQRAIERIRKNLEAE